MLAFFTQALDMSAFFQTSTRYVEIFFRQALDMPAFFRQALDMSAFFQTCTRYDDICFGQILDFFEKSCKNSFFSLGSLYLMQQPSTIILLIYRKKLRKIHKNSRIRRSLLTSGNIITIPLSFEI